MIWLEAYLLNSYNNYLFHPRRQRLINWEHCVTTSTIKSIIDKSENSSYFTTALENMNRGSSNIGDLSIEHLLKKINITESFKTN